MYNIVDLVKLKKYYPEIRLYVLLISNDLNIKSIDKENIKASTKAINMYLKMKGYKKKVRSKSLLKMLDIPEEELERLGNLYLELECS